MSQPPVEPSGTEPQPETADSSAPTARPRRLSPPTFTLVLAGMLVLALGFLGGIGVSKLAGGGTNTNAAPSATRSGFGFRSSASGQPSGNPGNALIGTVEKIHGNTVYVKTPNGKTVKVTTTASTSIRVSQQGSVDDLSNGSNVTVHGSKHGNTMSAQTINQGNNLPQRRPAASPTP